jgi:hypothetical protein
LARWHAWSPPRPPAPVIEVDDVRRALDVATDPVEIKEINAKLDAFEQYMHDAVFTASRRCGRSMRRGCARLKLGRALAEVERRQGKRNDPTSSTRLTNFGSFLEKLGLTRQTAVDVQRIV